MSVNSRDIYQQFSDGLVVQTPALNVEWAGIRVCVRSNSNALLDNLADYFSHCLVRPGAASVNAPGKQIDVMAVECDAPSLAFDFQDWRREPGKQGKKDSYIELSDGRLLRKVRTGMVFLQNENYLLAAGPCLANSNQVINFINSQLMNHFQHQGYVICHAAAAKVNGAGLALAGFSGGGKSTLMLKLLDSPNSQFISNDRLFLKQQPDGVHALGIPKMPRVNPGTLLNNPRLRELMHEEDRQQFEALAFSELWDLEYKYDVPVDRVYGADRILASTDLLAVIILNWQHESPQPTAIQSVDISSRQELLAAIKKAPGPFYQDAQGGFLQDAIDVNDAPYLRLLENTQVWELSGKVDIEKGVTLIREQLAAEALCHE